MTVGEGPGISLDNASEFVSEIRIKHDFPFDHMFIDHGENRRFDPIPLVKQFKDIL